MPAHASCVSPSREEGAILYNSDSKVFQYCDGADWIAMHLPGSGGGGCALVPSGMKAEGRIIYNADYHVLQGCAGDQWQAMGPVGGSVAKASWDNPAQGPVLDNPDPTTSDFFGISVAVDGTTAVVAAYLYDPGGIDGAGTAYIFDTATGALLATLNNPDPTTNDLFGFSVSVSGTIAVVGAYGDAPGGVSLAGTAYIFDTASGALITTLNNPDPTINDRFGFSVSVSDTTAVVGAYGDTPGGISGAGTAYVFDTATGALITTLNNPDPTMNDLFGISVAVNGTTAVVGATWDDPGGIADAGTAYVFDTTTGALIATLDNPAPATNDQFGSSVAVEGTTAVIGVPLDDPGGISDAGTAYVFDTASGALIATLDNPAPANDDRFGRSGALYGATAVVGAAADDPGGVSGAGTAYIFTPGLPGVCDDPARPEGALLYNSSSKVMQYCDGANWVGIGKSVPAGLTGCPNVGDVCSDGSIFAGDTNMYVTDVNQSPSIQWSTETVNTGADSSTDGAANQAWIVANETLSQYPAFELCENLIRHGSGDWYLPSRNELNHLYPNRHAIGGFTASNYWSSTENTNGTAWRQRFSDGFQVDFTKTLSFGVRCVRRQ